MWFLGLNQLSESPLAGPRLAYKVPLCEFEKRTPPVEQLEKGTLSSGQMQSLTGHPVGQQIVDFSP